MAWDHTVDLVVIGTGAGGLTTALRAADLGAEVLLLEKTDRYGGSTAMSGGVCWVPCNPHMAKAGVADDPDAALTYLRHITGQSGDAERLRAYVEHAPRMVRELEARSAVRFQAIAKYPDYYPEAPGGRPGARSMEPVPFRGTRLGEEFRHIRLPHPQSQVMGRLAITATEAHALLCGGSAGRWILMQRGLAYAFNLPARRRYGRDPRLCAGNALVARLRRSLMDRDVPLWRGTEVKGLVVEEGVVVGVEAERGGVALRVRGRKGVVLAAGGFERNAAMREAWQRAPITTEWTAASPASTGDGIRMGLEVGGAVDLMGESWWTPTTLVPGSDLGWVLVVEKSLPHGIIVNRRGERFCNEAAPYLDVVHRMYEDEARTGATVPSFLVFDATFRQRYPVGPIAPGYAQPDGRVSRRFKDGKFLTKADSLEGLAAALELPADRLVATVARFNAFAATGVDADFRRGESLSDRYYADRRATPNPCLGPLATPPFYAIRVYPGDLGTKGGLRTDAQGRVLTAQGSVIAGLYATGNCSAAVMGMTYPGAGGTIGPAMCFGWLAAEHACQGGPS